MGAIFVAVFFGTPAMAASVGTIDPNNAGDYKAAFLDNSVVADPSINFGKFTTESQYDITVSDTALSGYAWGSSIGWIVMNCSDTTSGCSGTNGNFAVANSGSGLLSGYAWGENTGWINFGPFTDPSISTVQIATNGNFGGTLGSAGYAWSQNYGWIVFDCTNPNTCVNTSWRAATPDNGQGGVSGGGPPGAGGATSNQQTITVVASNVVCDSTAAIPQWGNGGPAITVATARNFVAQSNGHCQFASGQSFFAFSNGQQSTFGPTLGDGFAITTVPLAPGTNRSIYFGEIPQPGYIPFTFTINHNNSDPVSAQFYCANDPKSYYSLNLLQDVKAGGTYYCVAFNVPGSSSSPTPPVTPPTPPATLTPPPQASSTTSPTSAPQPSPSNGNNSDSTEQPTTQPSVNPTTEPPNNPAQQTSEPGPFSSGLLLPPALADTLNDIIDSVESLVIGIIDIGRELYNPYATNSEIGQPQTNVVARAVTGVFAAARTSVGTAVTTAISAVGVVTTAAGAIALIALANPISLADIAMSLIRLWTFLPIFFGFKKRQYPWGTVYDSVTKQPIDPAYVILTDMQGNEVATSITDIDGRYGFSVAAGTYKIVANKTNYEFPSKKLAGRSGDELYDNLYFGDTIVVKSDSDVIIKNIPLDQLNFDWNEFAKNEQKRLSYYRHSDVIIARVSNFLFWLGFFVATIALFASDTTYNGIIFVLYIIMFVIRHHSPQFKAKGSISEALTDQPSSFAILHVLSAGTGQEITHKVADRLGNYYCLVPNGSYNIVIDRKNADGGYTKIPLVQPVTVKKGYLKESFKI